MTKGKGLIEKAQKALHCFRQFRITRMFVSFSLGSFCHRWYVDFVKASWKETSGITIGPAWREIGGLLEAHYFLGQVASQQRENCFA
jgi:valyl-tRNA synthetase